MVAESSNDASRNCGSGSLVESPLDLHYAFRNDYTADATSVNNYSLIYPNSGYYTTSPNPASYVDFNAMGLPNQTTPLLPNYSNYSPNIPYNGLMNTVQTPTTPIPPTICAHNGSIFDGHVTDDFLTIQHPSSDTPNANISKTPATRALDNFDAKFNEYVNDANKLLDVASVSADELNCLLNDENLSTHQMQATVPSPVNNGGCINGTGSVQPNATDSHAFLRFESDYANKLNANHSYGSSHSTESRPTTRTTTATTTATAANDDKSNDLFQKNSVLTT